MRFLLKMTIPTEAGNAALSDPAFGEKMQKYLTDAKVEAAYFTAVNEQRGGYLFVSMDDVSQMPGLIEPLYLWLNASVEIVPVMVPEDMVKAGPSIGEAVKTWG